MSLSQTSGRCGHRREANVIVDSASPCPFNGAPFVVMVPLFNDWTAVDAMLTELSQVCDKENLRPHVLLIDDGSTTRTPVDFLIGCPTIVDRVHILALRRNIGHQRAIAIGLAYLSEQLSTQPVIVMDGDGEDAPTDVFRLWKQYLASVDDSIVFAERSRRSESVIFRIFYRLYKAAHLFLTGYHVCVGNFSLVPYAALQRLVAVSELWNHYAAAVYKARLPFTTIPTNRAERLCGRSKMNFTSLVIHGLSAMSVHAETIGTRALVSFMIIAVLCVLGLLAVVGIRLGTTLAIPGWATVAVGILTLIFMQTVMLALLFVFVILGGRQSSTFLPIRDYRYYVLQLEYLVDVAS